MKFDIPFYKQQAAYDCAPTALKMILDYLGGNYPKEKIMSLVDSDKSGNTWTIALAKTAAQIGFKAEFYTTALGLNPQNYELEYYKKIADAAQSTQQKLERIKSECVKLGVHMEERQMSIEEILSKINENCAAVILLDWGKIRGISGYIGHTVPIAGYDDENVYIHNQGEVNPGAFIAIRKELFDEARKAKGTDEDIVFVYRKK